MKKLKIAVIIPVYNETNYIEDCLEAVFNQTRLADEVIVVDNNSTDNTIEICKRFPVDILHEPQQGQVFGRLRGFNAASSEILVTIDADTILDPGWLAEVQTRFSKDPNAAVTSLISVYDGRVRGLINLAMRVIYVSQKLITRSYGLYGSGMALSKQDWLKIRDQIHLDPSYCEDLEIGILLNRLGRKIQLISKPRIGISCRRAGSSSRALLPYLLQWPRTVWAYNKAQAAFIYPFVVFMWLGALPLHVVLYGSFKDWPDRLKNKVRAQ